MTNEEHWQADYQKKRPDEVSWYQPHLERSMAFIRSSGVPRAARIVDVGGGASTLVDDLLDERYERISVIDLAEAALGAARQRLGARAAAVEWIVGDVTTPLVAQNSVDFWHDRAVFHFLTAEDTRSAYLTQVHRAVKPGGHVLVATFGLDGPEHCSGLPVYRYDAAGIHATFGRAFEKVGDATEHHQTPSGTVQSFVYCFCRRG